MTVWANLLSLVAVFTGILIVACLFGIGNYVPQQTDKEEEVPDKAEAEESDDSDDYDRFSDTEESE